MKDCPACGFEGVDGLVCPKCGEGTPPTHTTGKDGHRVQVHRGGNFKLCDHEERGQLCAKIAVFSPATGGHGPWFCRQHNPTGAYADPPVVQAPTSFDLTESQWYADCKFFPTIARRCRRPFADVGPHNPLDAEVVLGPLLRHYRPPRVMRQPGEEG